MIDILVSQGLLLLPFIPFLMVSSYLLGRHMERRRYLVGRYMEQRR